MHIAIAGNIGSGKTTMTNLLANKFDWQPHFESVEDNPFLQDFYQDMNRWSFNLQIYFLQNRFQQIKDIQSSNHTIIQDRTIYEDAKIFAPNLYDMNCMSDRDFSTYKELFSLIESFLSPPDLLIYLQADMKTLEKQIALRGREYERSIEKSYLENLNDRYENWAKSYNKGPMLVLPINDIDIVNSSEDKEMVFSKIQDLLIPS
jgi:deoxyadenosine/deoxycytidine kinase